MTTSARMVDRKKEGEPRGGAATAGSPGRDSCTGDVELDGCMAEIRSTISRVVWRRSVAEVGLWRHYKVRLRTCAAGKRAQ